MVKILGQRNPVLQEALARLRDKNLQQEREGFRRNLQRTGMVMAYEIAKGMKMKTIHVESPLGIAQHEVLDEKVVLLTILRASIPMWLGFLEVFKDADSTIISAKRDEKTLQASIEYGAISDFKGKTLLIIDPMIATGNSICSVYKKIIQHGKPQRVLVAGLIGSPEGVKKVEKEMGAEVYIVSLDKKLNDQGYILPGLGDAGDLCFGKKQ